MTKFHSLNRSVSRAVTIAAASFAALAALTGTAAAAGGVGTANEYINSTNPQPGPWGVATVGNTVWVTGAAQHRIIAWNVDGTSTSYSVGTGNAPRGLVASSDGSTLYWASGSASGGVGETSTASPGSSTLYSTGFTAGAASDLAFAAGDRYIWVTQPTINTIAQYDTTTHQATGLKLTTGVANPQAIIKGSDGLMYFTNRSGTTQQLVRFDPTSGSPTAVVVGTFPNAAQTSGLAEGGDGRIYVALGTRNEVRYCPKQAAATCGIVSLTAASTQPNGVGVDQDGNIWVGAGTSSASVAASATTVYKISTSGTPAIAGTYPMDVLTSNVSTVTMRGIAVGPDKRIWIATGTASALAPGSVTAIQALPIQLTVAPQVTCKVGSGAAATCGASIPIQYGTPTTLLGRSWTVINSPGPAASNAEVVKWQRCKYDGTNCTTISSGNAWNYNPVKADVGKVLRACVTYTSLNGISLGLGTTEETNACSDVTGLVTATNRSKPVISGSISAPKVNDNLSLASGGQGIGVWDGVNSGAVYTWNWLSCTDALDPLSCSTRTSGSSTNFATNWSYKVGANDVNSFIRLSVTLSQTIDGVVRSVSAFSDATGRVSA